MAILTDDKKIGDMTVNEVKKSMDPDFGLQLREDFIESLKDAEDDIQHGRVSSWEDLKTSIRLTKQDLH